MKVKFTGSAYAPVTYLGKYEVETGSEIEVDDVDGNFLLQTGSFEAVDEGSGDTSTKDDGSTKKSSDDDSSKDTKGK
jgi:hypothetical protein